MRFALAALATCFAACGSGEESAGPQVHSGAAVQPNIVIVLADDLRADFLGFQGHPFVETPHIDRLAAEGVAFENAFAVTPVCSPSRASFLSGLYPHLHGVTSNTGQEDIDEEELETLPLRLQRAGYATAFFGKYHLGGRSAPRPGYDHWEAFAGRRGAGGYFDAALNVNGAEKRISGYSTDVLAERAVEWIRDVDERPFFVLLATKNVHAPMHPPARHAQLYADVNIELPESRGDALDRLPRQVQNEIDRDHRVDKLLETGGGDDRALRELRRTYARAVPSIDDAVGRLDAALSELGLQGNTIFVFTSDHGYLLGEHGLIRKGLAYEESVRIPLVIRFPRLDAEPGRRSELALNVDLPATLLDLAGAGLPAGIDGRSLAPVLLGEASDWPSDWLYLGRFFPQSRSPRAIGIHTGDWKYVRYREQKIEEELFDLRVDPHERHNQARNPDAEPTLERLRARTRELMTEHHAPKNWWRANPAARTRKSEEGRD